MGRPILREFSLYQLHELPGQTGKFLGIIRDPFIPLLLGFPSAIQCLPEIIERLIRHKKWRICGPTKILLGQFHFLDAERRAMGLKGVLLVGRAIAYMRPDKDKRRAMGFSLNIGLALILCLTVFVTWNDLVELRIVEYFIGLVT